MIIKEEWVHDAVNYLLEASGPAAAAKGMVIRNDYNRRKVRAKLILEAPHSSHGMREAYAEAHADYEAACEALARSEEIYEGHRNERNKCELIIEAWRTQSATVRGLGRVA